MLRLLCALWLAATPSPAPLDAPQLDAPVQTETVQLAPIGDPIQTETVQPAPIEGPALSLDTSPTPPVDQAQTRRMSKGERLVLGGSLAFAIGAGAQWLTLGATGSLAPNGRLDTGGGEIAGMTLGGLAMVEGGVLAGIAAGKLGRERADQLDRRDIVSLRAGGASIATLGSLTLAGTAMLWPTIRDRCPIGSGCTFGGLHAGGALLGLGLGMVAFAEPARRRQPGFRRLPKRAKEPLTIGGALLGTSYFLTAMTGMMIWQDDPGDATNRRVRNHLLIPVVGAWIYAAGPDSPLLAAMATGVIGAVQIGGTIALAVGATRAGRARGRVQLSVAPRLDGGLTLVGRF